MVKYLVTVHQECEIGKNQNWEMLGISLLLILVLFMVSKLSWSDQGHWDKQGMWHALGGREMLTSLLCRTWRTMSVRSKGSVNKSPTRCNSTQTFIYCRVTLHVSGVTAPIIRSTKNCICHLWYKSCCKIQIKIN